MRKLFVLTLFALACGANASATAIAITNASFELPAVGLGSFNNGPITGWVNTGVSGVFRPIIGSQFNSIPDGLQTSYSNGGTISQILSATLLNSSTYTLQVDVGRRLDCCGFPAYTVQLFAGATLLGTAPTVSPGLGNFMTATLTYTSSAADSAAGQALRIVLDVPVATSGGNQVDFDNVRLDGPGTSGVPEPASISLLGTGLGGLVLAGLRRRQRRA